MRDFGVSKILLVLAFVCFLLAFLTVVAGAKLVWPAEGWAYAGLSLFALASLI